MKKRYTVLITLIFLSLTAPFITETLSIPEVQAIYGGRIQAINGYVIHTDSTRIFVSTESANSVFYADVYSSTTGTPVVSNFTVVSSLNNTQGFGSRITTLQIHEPSEQLVFINENNELYSTTIDDATATNTSISGVQDVLIKADNTFAAGSGNMYFGTLNTTGNYTPGTGSPISFPTFSDTFKIVHNNTNNKLYIFSKGTTPKLYISSEIYTSFNASTIFTDISPSLTSTTVRWTAFGVAPDGRWFLIGNDGATKFIAYSDDSGTTWTEFDTSIVGISANNFSFSGSPTNYHVFSSTIVSNNKGISGTWNKIGATTHYTHPNDGAVFVDPNNNNILYSTSDQGLGVSFDKGVTVSSADAGIEAVQVNDMEMTEDKTIGWIASKSGIRKVTDYTTIPSWTNAIFPNGDGSGYHSIGMNPSDDTSVYAGNIRIYKTSDNGTNWTKVFTPESAPYNFPSVGTMAKAITVCPYDETIVFAGFEIKDTDKGGLFISEDAGATWAQLLLHASSAGNDVDVRDIVFTEEAGVITAYIGVEYDLSAPTGRSIYKAVQTGSGWTVTQDMSTTTTSTGAIIVVSINDLEYEASNTTVYATGTDAGENHPTNYYKPLSGTGLWTVNTSAGLPITSVGNAKVGKATTYGIDTLYCAVENEVYYLANTASSWTKGYSYPNGTKINFLYFDELLVGTDTGLFAQYGPSTKTAGVIEVEQRMFTLYPNPIKSSAKLTINFNTNINSPSIKLYTLNGQLLHEVKEAEIEKNNTSIQFPIPIITSGVYFLKIFDKRKELVTKKIIIE